MVCDTVMVGQHWAETTTTRIHTPPSVFTSLSLYLPQSWPPSVFTSLSLYLPQSLPPSVFTSLSLYLPPPPFNWYCPVLPSPSSDLPDLPQPCPHSHAHALLSHAHALLSHAHMPLVGSSHAWVVLSIALGSIIQQIYQHMLAAVQRASCREVRPSYIKWHKHVHV